MTTKYKIALLSICCSFFSLSAFTQRPNIIYILADDMGYGDISALNKNSKINTPNIDALVQSGISYDDYHTSSAVCTPTRYSILTGRYDFRSRLKKGVLVGHSPSLIENNTETVGEYLQKTGYNTAFVGKWHLGLDWKRKDTTKPLFTGDEWNIENTSNVDYHSYVKGGPNDKGFHYSYYIPASLDIAPYVYLKNGVATARVEKRVPRWQGEERGQWFRKGDVADDFDHFTSLEHLTDKSVAYIDSVQSDSSPFFLFFSLTAPHTPWVPATQYIGKSGAGAYGDFVIAVDNAVGKIIHTLKQKNLLQNTLIVFTSDNGAHWTPEDIAKFGHHSNFVYKGMKSDLWEGGHRVPFIISWPEGIKANQRNNDLLCSTDFYATVVQLTNGALKNDQAGDSFSFYPTFSGKKNYRKRSAVLHHAINGDFAVRQGDYVYMELNGSGGWSQKEEKNLPGQYQLYNLRKDISQKNNLYGKKKYAGRSAKMKQTLHHLLSSSKTR